MPNKLAASRMDSWFEMYHINNNNCFSGGIYSLPLTLLEVECGAIVCKMISMVAQSILKCMRQSVDENSGTIVSGKWETRGTCLFWIQLRRIIDRSTFLLIKYNIVPLSFINYWMQYSILRVKPTGEFPFDLACMYACAFLQNVFTTIWTSNPSLLNRSRPRKWKTNYMFSLLLKLHTAHRSHLFCIKLNSQCLISLLVWTLPRHCNI